MKTDIVIIGAGIIGCSIAYELAKYDIDVTVLEKSSYVASGSTKANSAMLHEGLSTKPNTLRERFVKNGRQELEKVMELLDVPYKKEAGLITIAFNDDELNQLKKQAIQAKESGLDGNILSKDEILSLEPNINPEIIGGFYSKSVGIIAPYELCIAMAENAAKNGVKFIFNSEVIQICKENELITKVITNNQEFETKFVFDAAGINSDIVAKMVDNYDFYVKPRKGEYYLYDKDYGNMFSHVISVLGNSQSKGMIIVPTIHGNLLAGSSAMMIDDKNDFSTSEDTLNAIYQDATSKICPKLDRKKGVITTFAGLRAVSNTEDFIIESGKTVKNFVCLVGIQSPGLSSCINIAKYAIDICKNTNIFSNWKLKKDYIATNKKRKRIVEMSPEEANKLIFENPNYGEIVCRCELITKGEIIDAIHSDIPAITVDAIKRKLRCGMGRCQGGFCLQRILKIIHEETSISMTDIKKDINNSNYLMVENRNEVPNEKL